MYVAQSFEFAGPELHRLGEHVDRDVAVGMEDDGLRHVNLEVSDGLEAGFASFTGADAELLEERVLGVLDLEACFLSRSLVQHPRVRVTDVPQFDLRRVDDGGEILLAGQATADGKNCRQPKRIFRYEVGVGNVGFDHQNFHPRVKVGVLAFS